MNLKSLPILAFCFFSAQLLSAQEDGFTKDFLLRWENAKTYSLAVASAMPETEYNFKPTATEMSFAEQLVHMGKNILMLSKNYLPPIDKPVPELKGEPTAASKADINKFLADCFDYAAAVLRPLSQPQLDETVPFFAGPLSRRRVVMLLNDHQAHHRGQLIVYLRLNNITPPPYVGW